MSRTRLCGTDRLLCAVAFLLCALALAMPCAGDALLSVNLVSNGNFDIWAPAPSPPADPKAVFPTFGPDGAPADWHCSAEITPGIDDPDIKPGAGIFRDQTVKCAGQSSLRFENGATTDIASAFAQFDIEPNTRYKVSCWVKGENIVSSRNDGTIVWVQYGPKANIWAGGRVAAHVTDTHVGTFDWHHVEYAADTDDEAQTMHVTVQLRNASGKAWFDDIQVIKIGPIVHVDSY
jgi:hypothetical protein